MGDSEEEAGLRETPHEGEGNNCLDGKRRQMCAGCKSARWKDDPPNGVG